MKEIQPQEKEVLPIFTNSACKKSSCCRIVTRFYLLHALSFKLATAAVATRGPRFQALSCLSHKMLKQLFTRRFKVQLPAPPGVSECLLARRGSSSRIFISESVYKASGRWPSPGSAIKTRPRRDDDVRQGPLSSSCPLNTPR